MQTCQRLSDLHVSMRVHSMDKDCCVPQRSHLHLSVTLTVTRVMVFNQCLWNEQQDKEWCYGNLFQPMSLEWATGQTVLLWQSFQPVSLEWTTGQRVLLWQSFQPMPLEWTTGQRVLLWQAYIQSVSLEWAAGQRVLLWQSISTSVSGMSNRTNSVAMTISPMKNALSQTLHGNIKILHNSGRVVT